MFLRKLFMTSILLLFSFNAAFSAEDDPVLAKAGDHIFKKSDLDRFFSYAPPLLRQQMKSNPEQQEMLVRHLMKQKIIGDIARKEGFDRKKDIQEQLRYMTDDFLAKAYLVNAIVEKASVADDEVRKYYERNKEKYTVPEQALASHILIKVNFGATAEEKKKARDKAKQILEWLKKGEKFETLAKQYSDDPQSKEAGGKMGYIPKGRMPKAFDEQAFSMKPGQISDVVETDYGFHVIQVEDHKDAVTRQFDEVTASIREELGAERGQKKAEEFIRDAEKGAGLEVFTDKIKEASKK